MREIGIRGERASKEDLKYFSQFSSWAEFLDNEFPPLLEGNNHDEQRLQRELVAQSKDNKRNKTPGFKDLQGRVIMNSLRHMSEYKLLDSLLHQPERAEEITDAIKKVREKFFDIKIFKRRAVGLIEDKSQYEKCLQSINDRYKEPKGVYDPDSIEKPSYNSKIEVNKLYHWIPEEFVGVVKTEGLVPGFLTGLNKLAFVYASLERSEFWPYNINYSRRGLAQPRKFIELEIDYDQSLEAYLWLPYYGIKDGIKRYETLYPGVALSSNLFPLERQVAELVHCDPDREVVIEPGTPTYFSTLQNCEMPLYGGNTSSVANWEMSEVLLNYVAPKRLKVIGEMTVNS